MILLRILLVVFLVVFAPYTVMVSMNHGLDIFPLFFGEVEAMTWQGQFNLDFLGYLILSALWVMWRHDFSPIGVLLGLLALFGGMTFQTIYLLVLLAQAKGDMTEVLLGRERAAR